MNNATLLAPRSIVSGEIHNFEGLCQFIVSKSPSVLRMQDATGRSLVSRRPLQEWCDAKVLVNVSTLLSADSGTKQSVQAELAQEDEVVKFLDGLASNGADEASKEEISLSEVGNTRHDDNERTVPTD